MRISDWSSDVCSSDLDDEQGGYEDDFGIAEARQRFIHADDSVERENAHQDERDGIHARPVDGEHDDGHAEQAENEGQIRAHLSFNPLSKALARQNRAQFAAASISSSFAAIAAPTWICGRDRSEEHTSELQSLMRISYAVFCLKKKKQTTTYL